MFQRTQPLFRVSSDRESCRVLRQNRRWGAPSARNAIMSPEKTKRPGRSRVSSRPSFGF